jgi:hypothetical protein
MLTLGYILAYSGVGKRHMHILPRVWVWLTKLIG